MVINVALEVYEGTIKICQCGDRYKFEGMDNKLDYICLCICTQVFQWHSAFLPVI